MELDSATVRVLVEVAMRVQIRERGRIGHPFVEITNFLARVHLGPPRISGLSAPSTSSAGGGRPKACRPKPNKGAQCIPALASCIIANAWSRVKVLGF